MSRSMATPLFYSLSKAGMGMIETKAKAKKPAKKRKPLTKDNPARMVRDVSIAKDRLSGCSYSDLAKTYGISMMQISRILNDSDIKDIINTGTSTMVSMIPLANQVYHDRLRDNDKPELQLKAAQDVAKISGIMPGAVLNQTINNIYNQQNNIVTTETAALVRRLLPGFDEDIIDAQ